MPPEARLWEPLREQAKPETLALLPQGPARVPQEVVTLARETGPFVYSQRRVRVVLDRDTAPCGFPLLPPFRATFRFYRLLLISATMSRTAFFNISGSHPPRRDGDTRLIVP